MINFIYQTIGIIVIICIALIVYLYIEGTYHDRPKKK